MTDQNGSQREPLNPNSTYYAVYFDDSRSRVVGVCRRTPKEGLRYPIDEAFTTNLKWERTFFFIDEQFGKGSDEPYEEISIEEARRIVDEIYDRRSKGGVNG